jgi:pimeloyl-ACP methyl ester carboxylesterase
MPALLITGGQDPTTSFEQGDAFHHASPRHAMAEFERAGHFAHADDPEAYARLVTDFARSSSQR